MKKAKKIAVFIPVLLVSCVFLGIHYFHQYLHTTPRRLIALNIAILFFYTWVVIGILRRRQNSFWDVLLQSSYYVYLFSVLTLTGYFILFNQVSAHNWWHKMVTRVQQLDGVNLRPFMFAKMHSLFSYEVVGNFIMLLPLGIYLPLLYPRIRNFISVTLVAMMVSVSIELMQLATSTRITDIDDVILNTAGASLGFIIYFIIYKLVLHPAKPMASY